VVFVWDAVVSVGAIVETTGLSEVARNIGEALTEGTLKVAVTRRICPVTYLTAALISWGPALNLDESRAPADPDAVLRKSKGASLSVAR
jgi:hypothetical protein